MIADAERPVGHRRRDGGPRHRNQRRDDERADRSGRVRAACRSATTARKLGLHSDSSYRFERGIDRQGLDWASRRCVAVDSRTGRRRIVLGLGLRRRRPRTPSREPIVLRLSQIPASWESTSPKETVVRILKALGLSEATAHFAETVSFIPPSWRRDLTREIDLIEEVARIHGYDKIPEDVLVPLEVSKATLRDQLSRAAGRRAAGCRLLRSGDADVRRRRPGRTCFARGPTPRRCASNIRRGSARTSLRQSLIPSLLACRRQNERQKNFNAQLFEIRPRLPGGRARTPGVAAEPARFRERQVVRRDEGYRRVAGAGTNPQPV